MALNLNDKKAIVAEVAEVASTAFSAVAAEYAGLTVEQMTELRAKARESGVYLRVVKNTLARRAVQGTDFECIGEALTGPRVLAFSQEDPGSAARVIKDFAKDNAKLEVKLVSIGGQLLAAGEIDIIRRWIAEGAVWPSEVVLEPPVLWSLRNRQEYHGSCRLCRYWTVCRGCRASANWAPSSVIVATIANPAPWKYPYQW